MVAIFTVFIYTSERVVLSLYLYSVSEVSNPISGAFL